MKSKKRKAILVVIIISCLLFLYLFSLEITQRKLNELGRKARNREYHKFTLMDKIFLQVFFRTLIIGGHLLGLKGAAVVFNHYLSGKGEELIVEPKYFRQSPVIKEILAQHYQRLRISNRETKVTKIKVNPASYGIKDINLFYMMNPFTLNIRDSLGGDLLFSKYVVNSFISFYPGKKTYFPFPGKIIVFPSDIGVALKHLGMGEPFQLKSVWYDTIPWR